MTTKLRNCWTCENLNSKDQSCAVLRENARSTTQEERRDVTVWRRSAAWGQVPREATVTMPSSTADGCPGYVSDDLADYPDAKLQSTGWVPPPTTDQLREAIQGVLDLNDPLVEWEPRGFGSSSDPAPAYKLDPAKLYVNVHAVNGAAAYCVKQAIVVPPTTPANKHFTIPNEILRWHFATPPWGHPSDLPSLATAVALHRLPQDAFPDPEKGLAFTPTGMNVGGIEIPLWKFMQATGRIP